jgi:hypothetical protein
MRRFPPNVPSLLCRDCPYWYGAEDDGYGPCTIKSQRGESRPLTYGAHVCDEGYDVVSGQIVFLGVVKAKPALKPKPAPQPAARVKPTKRAPAKKKQSKTAKGRRK